MAQGIAPRAYPCVTWPNLPLVPLSCCIIFFSHSSAEISQHHKLDPLKKKIIIIINASSSNGRWCYQKHDIITSAEFPLDTPGILQKHPSRFSCLLTTHTFRFTPVLMPVPVPVSLALALANDPSPGHWPTQSFRSACWPLWLRFAALPCAPCAPLALRSKHGMQKEKKKKVNRTL